MTSASVDVVVLGARRGCFADAADTSDSLYLAGLQQMEETLDADLGAFTDFVAMIGRRVADFENATAYQLLNLANGDGPTLITGDAPVFGTGATRVNKASAGTALDEANIAKGR